MRGYRPNRSGGPWTSFFVAVLFLLLFPLFPLGAELLFTQQITMASLMLMTATYATSLSMSSQHVGRWALGLSVGLMFSTLFGWCMGRGDGSMGPAFRLQPGPPRTRDGSGSLCWASAACLPLTCTSGSSGM